MSGASMAMPGAITLGAAGAFVVSWMGMMAAMMLPSVAPPFWRYHRAVARLRDARPGRLTAIAVAGCLAVWGVAGAVVYPLDVGLAALRW